MVLKIRSNPRPRWSNGMSSTVSPSPSKSSVSVGSKELLPALIAGLTAAQFAAGAPAAVQSACVWVGPPLIASGASRGSIGAACAQNRSSLAAGLPAANPKLFKVASAERDLYSQVVTILELRLL